MKRLIFLIMCLMFSAIFVFAQTPQTIQAGFTVESELGETNKRLSKTNLRLNWSIMIKWKKYDLKKIGQTKQRGSVPHLPIRDYCPHPSNH